MIRDHNIVFYRRVGKEENPVHNRLLAAGGEGRESWMEEQSGRGMPADDFNQSITNILLRRIFLYLSHLGILPFGAASLLHLLSRIQYLGKVCESRLVIALSFNNTLSWKCVHILEHMTYIYPSNIA